MGRLCGDYEKQTWLRGRIVGDSGEVARPRWLCSSVVDVAKGGDPKVERIPGESC